MERDVENCEVEIDYSNRDVLAEIIHKKTITTLQKLDTIWDEIGVKDEVRKTRGEAVLGYVNDLYHDMLQEAEEQKVAALKNVDALISELTKLANNLQTNVIIAEYADVPLNIVQQELTTKLQEFENLFKSRKLQVDKLIFLEETLCSDLGKTPKSLGTTVLPTQEQLDQFQTYLDQLLQEKNRRVELFLSTKADLIKMMDELQLKPTMKFEEVVVSGLESAFRVTDVNMQRLAELRASVEEQVKQVRDDVAELRQQLEALWERLEVEPQHRNDFLALHPLGSSSLATLRALKDEVARCQAQKRANIKVFVDRVRDELAHWWAKCRYTTQQRTDLLYVNDDCYNEDLLEIHERQIDVLKQQYADNKAIYELATKREQLWNKMLELERRASQPERFKNRGGQLLREEKERKAVASQLPKIEQQLLDLVEQYEIRTSQPFLLDGERVSELVSRAWDEHKENRHVQLSAKKQAREQQTLLTPAKSPGCAIGARLTPALTPAPIVTPTSSTAKRRRLDTPMFSSAAKRTAPKLQLNGSTIKKASRKIRQRLETKRRSRELNKTGTLSTSTFTDYSLFEMGLETKAACRSTLFQRPGVARKRCTSPCSTPRNPHRTRTPTRTPTNTRTRTPTRTPTNTRTCTPTRTNTRSPNTAGAQLSAAPVGTLPIII